MLGVIVFWGVYSAVGVSGSFLEVEEVACAGPVAGQTLHKFQLGCTDCDSVRLSSTGDSPDYNRVAGANTTKLKKPGSSQTC
jgi:hypothetical protein